MNWMNWTKSLMPELGSIYNLNQHRKQFSVMVSMPDYCASDLGSIPGQVCQLLRILFCSSNWTTIMKKLNKDGVN